MKATVYQSIVSEECDTKEYILVISPTLQTWGSILSLSTGVQALHQQGQASL